MKKAAHYLTVKEQDHAMRIFEKVVDKVDGSRALARATGINAANQTQVRRRRCVPEHWCHELVELAAEHGMSIDLNDLRPDMVRRWTLVTH